MCFVVFFAFVGFSLWFLSLSYVYFLLWLLVCFCRECVVAGSFLLFLTGVYIRIDIYWVVFVLFMVFCALCFCLVQIV